MSRDKLSIVLTVAGSALCWWPAIIEPSVDFPRWLLLLLLALIVGAATALSEGRWFRFVVAATIGTFAGLYYGFELFPASDGIEGSYRPLAVVLVTLLSTVVSIPAALAGRKLLVMNEELRRAVWIALISCVAFGPVVLALTPPLVARRVAHNDRLAAQRFSSLKNAVEQTIAESQDRERLCVGQALKRRY